MTRTWRFFIHDMLDAIRHIRSFMGDMTLEEFLADEKTRSAVAFKVENIGEAAKNVPREVRSRYRNIPWSDMAKMRDKVAHSYFGINYKTVWKVAKQDLAVIEPLIAQIVIDLKDAEEPIEQ